MFHMLWNCTEVASQRMQNHSMIVNELDSGLFWRKSPTSQSDLQVNEQQHDQQQHDDEHCGDHNGDANSALQLLRLREK